MKLTAIFNLGLDRGDEKETSTNENFLIQAVSLEESKDMYHLKMIIYFISFLVFGLGVWSGFAMMPEVASAQGEVIPIGRVHKVQHLEGGIIKNIYARNGDYVKTNDPLISLVDDSLRAELNSLESTKADLSLRLERLTSLIEGKTPEFGKIFNYNRLNEAQNSLYKEQIRNDQERLSSIDNKIRNRQAELNSKDKQTLALIEEVSIYQQQHTMRISLYDKGQVAKVDMLDTSARLSSAKNRLAEVEGEKEKLENAINELIKEKSEYQAKRREQWNTEKAEVTRQFAVTAQQIANAESRISRSIIRAQIQGIVKGLSVNSINTVIGSGEILMEIVPIEDELFVEAKLLPEDVGHVTPGLPVDVKVSSFEYQRFGGIKGEVLEVSASTYLDIDNSPYYLTEIKLAKNYVGDESLNNLIIPGMTVQADIVTGEKSILSYLLKPLQRGVDGAFSER